MEKHANLTINPLVQAKHGFSAALVAGMPKSPLLISSKKRFLNAWVKQPLHDYAKILQAVVESKRQPYSESAYEVNCYLPLRYTFLDKDKDFWKANAIDNHGAGSIHLTPHSDSISSLKNHSLVNLLKACEHYGIDWHSPMDSAAGIKEKTLLQATIICMMQMAPSHEIYQASRLNEPLMIAFDSCSAQQKLDILSTIMSSWNDIWHTFHKRAYASQLATGFELKVFALELLTNMTHSVLAQKVSLTPDLFEGGWQQVKLCFAGNQPKLSALTAAMSALELNSALQLQDTNERVKKTRKI